MLKRLFDIFLSLLGAILILLLLILIVFAIKLDSSGPVFFVQERGGLKRKRFYLYKFRSLKGEAEVTNQRDNNKELDINSPYITKAGRLFRKTGLDELPQFFNILRGDMSLVGPRPHPVAMDRELSKFIPHYYERLNVRPGLTGWAQVNGQRGPAMDPRVMKKRLAYDLWYIKHRSFLLDLHIIFLSAKQLIVTLVEEIQHVY